MSLYGFDNERNIDLGIDKFPSFPAVRSASGQNSVYITYYRVNHLIGIEKVFGRLVILLTWL